MIISPEGSDGVGFARGESQRVQVVKRLNDDYAMVMIGNAPAVLRESTGPDGKDTFNLLTVPGFTSWLQNVVIRETAPDGTARKVPASKAWLEAPDRRTYDGLVFDPSATPTADQSSRYYNLWKGFAVRPSEAGSCQRFLDHIAENVCSGDEALFAWVVGWFAAMIQRPTEKDGTALVLRGDQGTGKTIVGKVIGSLLGDHYALVADSRYILGRFNSHLQKTLLLQLDEATWGGDHAAAGKLKDLITGEWQFIEFKGKEPIRIRNYVRLFVTGNNSWLVPAGLEERRFAVIDVGDQQRQNHAYFKAIEDELDAGGREKLLHYLLTLDLADIPLRSIPDTPALLEQKVSSLAVEQQWWLDVMRRGVLPGDTSASGEVESDRLYEHYLERLNRMGIPRRQSHTAFGISLHRMVPGLIRQRQSVVTVSGSERRWFHMFPPLAECRAAFRRVLKIELQDGGHDDWQPCPGSGKDG